MQLSKNIKWVLLIILLIPSCIEPFNPKTNEYEEMLIIEGYLNDDPDNMTSVKISRTAPLNSEIRADYLEEDAVVTIECDDGAMYELDETFPGVYLDNSNLIIPEIGKTYRLTVTTKDNMQFQSDYQEFMIAPPIDSLSYHTDVKKVNELSEAVHGIQFSANSSRPDNVPLYLRWVLDGTYIYRVPYKSDYIWGPGLIEFYNYDSITCWRSDDINGIFLGSSYGLADNVVAEAELNFVSQYGYPLSEKYSLHAKQYSISKSAYEFWYDLNKTINETGGLYETIPFKISGNIACITNPELNVAGVFEVASTSEERIFISKPRDFPIIPPVCSYDTIGTETLGWGDLWPGDVISEVKPGLFMTSHKSCFFCTLLGGTVDRPPFWE